MDVKNVHPELTDGLASPEYQTRSTTGHFLFLIICATSYDARCGWYVCVEFRCFVCQCGTEHEISNANLVACPRGFFCGNTSQSLILLGSFDKKKSKIGGMQKKKKSVVRI